jgi:hypothetical protein
VPLLLVLPLLPPSMQMHKEVPPPRSWRPLVIRHQAFVARVYVAADKQALSSKSCIPRQGMHDMGAISGYGRSSRATSNLTTGNAGAAVATFIGLAFHWFCGFQALPTCAGWIPTFTPTTTCCSVMCSWTQALLLPLRAANYVAVSPTVSLFTGSVSNASFGTAQTDQQQQDDAGSKPEPQKGTAPAAAAVVEQVVQANGIKQEEPTVVGGQQQLQQQPAQTPFGQPQHQQQQESDDALLIAPGAAQHEQPLIGMNIAGVSGAELLMQGAAVAATPMETS